MKWQRERERDTHREREKKKGKENLSWDFLSAVPQFYGQPTAREK